MLDAKNYLGKMLAERYRLVRVIGHGASSLVFYAEDMMVMREDGSPLPVAIKLLDHDSGEYKMNSRSFRAEIQAVASIPTSPHIVAIKDVSYYEDEHFIVMEYVSGKTLKEYLKEKNGPLSPKEIVSISLQLLQALRLAHSVGVVHRDIKPENILVERADVVGKKVDIPGGEGMPFVKLTDFGIALLPDDDLFTMKDKGVGTIHYISPEQAGGGRADARSDIYSLGVLMHVMATGSVPFDAQSPTGIISKHQTEMQQHVRGQNADIPMILDEVIFNAMQKNPALRYRDALTMERALKEVLRVLEGGGVGVEGESAFVGIGIGGEEPTPAPKAPKMPKAPKTPKAPKPAKAPKMPAARSSGNTDKRKVLFIGIGAAALVVLLVVGAILLFTAPKTYDITVPSLTGTVYAEETVYPEGVVVVKDNIKYVYSDQIEAGKIVSQEPAQGTVVKDVEQLEIVLTVSLGPEMVDFSIPTEYRGSYEAAVSYLRATYGALEAVVAIDKTPEVAETRLPGVAAGTVVGAYRVNTKETLSLDGDKVYKTKGEIIKLIVQPADPYTFTLTLDSLIKVSDATQKIKELCPYLTVVDTKNSSKVIGVPGVVVGVCLADGKEVSTFDETAQTLTVTVEKDKPQSVYLLLSIG
ncbi:MAG: PASTA domain-containing protein [Ruminococcaceae bacterium]|nr:PASTA domain-containing protein [Oscillospiraceae bacterium]